MHFHVCIELDEIRQFLRTKCIITYKCMHKIGFCLSSFLFTDKNYNLSIILLSIYY